MDQAAELPASIPSRAVLVARLGIGLVQGLALFGLYCLVADRVPDPRVSAHLVEFGLLVLCVTLLPPAVLPILGHARIRVMAAWALAATGAILFRGIGLDTLDRLGGKVGFVLPVSAVLGPSASTWLIPDGGGRSDCASFCSA